MAGTSPIGGSIENITVDGQLFAVAADADATMSLGGYANEVQPNGDGTSRIIKTIIPWTLSGLSVAIDDASSNQESLQAVADGNVYVPITIRMASGVTYQGTGTITENVERSTQSATVSLSLSGQGTLSQQG
jgi:hypothetical protein